MIFLSEAFRADKPVNIRNGGVCHYFKENLPIKERIDLEIIPETIVAEVKQTGKKYFSFSHTATLTFQVQNMTNM